jgi:hypothetical protein
MLEISALSAFLNLSSLKLTLKTLLYAPIYWGAVIFILYSP